MLTLAAIAFSHAMALEPSKRKGEPSKEQMCRTMGRLCFLSKDKETGHDQCCCPARLIDHEVDPTGRTICGDI